MPDLRIPSYGVDKIMLLIADYEKQIAEHDCHKTPESGCACDEWRMQIDFLSHPVRNQEFLQLVGVVERFNELLRNLAIRADEIEGKVGK